MEQYVEHLQSRGRRATMARRAVIDTMAGLGEHFSAEELAQRVPHIGRATVYRTLRLLQDEGLLCRVLLESGGLHYRLTERGHHHHLTCTECGAVQDFSDAEVAGVMEGIARRAGFRMSGHWIEIYGMCGSCTQVAAAPASVAGQVAQA
ncbi:MAG TPA: Fur family transcriptional regulator [Dehalococcoidia bacterium]|nr:Fur family transcriptional regulator [Dehalococcoidia bacterium]